MTDGNEVFSKQQQRYVRVNVQIVSLLEVFILRIRIWYIVLVFSTLLGTPPSNDESKDNGKEATQNNSDR